jgi:hypothetical protein
MVSIRAHFDGSVFVPEEPVSVAPNAKVRLLVVDEAAADRPLMDLVRIGENSPAEAGWPADGAAEHDHYLYGSPKRES